jgi:hypothetical protein
MNLNTVRVFVRGIQSAKRFYGVGLGLQASADGSEHGYRVFQAGAAALVVEAVPGDAAQADQDLVRRFTGLSFEVSSAAAAYRDLRSRGFRLRGSRRSSSGEAHWQRSRIRRANDCRSVSSRERDVHRRVRRYRPAAAAIVVADRPQRGLPRPCRNRKPRSNIVTYASHNWHGRERQGRRRRRYAAGRRRGSGSVPWC